MPKDKLKAQYTKEEFEAYLLHEQGHLNFIGRLMTTVYALIMVFAFFFVYLSVLFWDRSLYSAMLRTIFCTFVLLLLGWMLNGLREYYADYYSWTHCCKKALISALKKIDRYKRPNLRKSILRNYTHPPLASRIRLIEKVKG